MNNCVKCGAEISKDRTLCLDCENGEVSSSKRKLNVTGIVGFAVSVIGLIVVASLLAVALKDVNADNANSVAAVLTTLLIVMPSGIGVGAIAFIVSVTGLIVGIVKKQRFKAFAIVGIVISVVVAASTFIAFAAIGSL